MAIRFLIICFCSFGEFANVSASDGLAQKNEVVERNVGSVEGGVQMGVNTLTDGTWNMGFEIRYNLKKVPVDVGLLTEVDFYNGVFNAVGKFAVVGDYNFKREKNFSQYVGCGVGYGILTRNSCCGSDDKVKCLILSPRAGIELLKFLRLTATLNIPIASHTPKYVSITAGICLGGRRK